MLSPCVAKKACSRHSSTAKGLTRALLDKPTFHDKQSFYKGVTVIFNQHSSVEITKIINTNSRDIITF